MASAAALKMAAALCLLLVLCVGSQATIARASPAAAAAKQQNAAGGGRNVGDACPAACQNCLILCAVKCVLKPSPVACYADCVTKDACFA
ncbi:hypothetical protein ABZP36_035479 [Zizania latifolia]